MNVTIGPKGILQLDDVRIIYRNFSGEGSKFNREGDKNFSVLIDNMELANDLIEQGWNVKIREPREEGNEPFAHLPVKVKFNDRGPRIYLITGNRRNKLDEESVAIIDNIDIACIDMDISPYDWEVNGKTGRTAYLHSMRVVQEVDRFAEDDYE